MVFKRGFTGWGQGRSGGGNVIVVGKRSFHGWQIWFSDAGIDCHHSKGRWKLFYFFPVSPPPSQCLDSCSSAPFLLQHTHWDQEFVCWRWSKQACDAHVLTPLWATTHLEQIIEFVGLFEVRCWHVVPCNRRVQLIPNVWRKRGVRRELRNILPGGFHHKVLFWLEAALFIQSGTCSTLSLSVGFLNFFLRLLSRCL